MSFFQYDIYVTHSLYVCFDTHAEIMALMVEWVASSGMDERTIYPRPTEKFFHFFQGGGVR